MKKKLTWSTTPPNLPGYWWAFNPAIGKRSKPTLVEVVVSGIIFRFKLPGNFNGYACNDYPTYVWAGPVEPPKLP